MQNPDALRAFFGRVTPVLPELFNMAHAICGNYDLAEYALQYTLLEAWRGESRGGMGFREGLKHTMRRIALQEALSSRQSAREYTWDGLIAPDGDALMELLAAESVSLSKLNRKLEMKFFDGIFKNSDYYSFLVHICQKKEYDLEQVLRKQDTFFEGILAGLLAESGMKKYRTLKFRLNMKPEAEELVHKIAGLERDASFVTTEIVFERMEE
jgi:hypothetical protein